MELTSLEQCSEQEFAECFESFKIEAFRLELLPHYDMEEEQNEFSAFRDGTQSNEPSVAIAEWCEEIRNAIKNGKHYSRVRVLSTPLSEYHKFEIRTGFKFSVAAGEKVRVLCEKDSASLNATIPWWKDFWLFDDLRGCLLDYSGDGKYLGAYWIPEESIPLYAALKAKAIDNSIPIQTTSFWNG